MAGVLENGDFSAGGYSWAWSFVSAVFPAGQHKAVVQEGKAGSQSNDAYFEYVGPHFQVPRGSDWRLRFHVKKIAANPVHGLGMDHWREEFFVSFWTPDAEPYSIGFEVPFNPWPGLDVPPGAEGDFDHTASLTWPLGFAGTMQWQFGVRGPGGFGIADPDDWGYGYELSDFVLEHVGGHTDPAWVDFLVSPYPLNSISTRIFDFSDYAAPPSPFVKTDWLWDFGDGDTSTDQNHRHTYAVGGTYYATETVTASDGATTITDSLTKQIYFPAGGGGGGDDEPPQPPPLPPPPTDTWGAFGSTFPGGCNGAALLSWDEPTFSRGPLSLAEIGTEESMPGENGDANSSNARWIGLGVIRYEIYVDGVLVAHTDATYNPDGSGYSPPPTSVSVPLSEGWFAAHHVQVKAIWDDMGPWGWWTPTHGECVPNCSGTCCMGIGPLCLEQDQPWNVLRAGFYPTDYAALGSFGIFGANIPCTRVNCTWCCIPCYPVCQCVPGLFVHTWETVDVPATTYTFDGPELDTSCSTATVGDDFEACEGDVIGDATCAEPGFACSGTHVLRCNVPGPSVTPGGVELAHPGSYWISPDGGGVGAALLEPNYMSCVLWPNLDWAALPHGYANEILVLAAITPAGDVLDFDHQSFFGVALTIEVGDAGDVDLFARGVRGFTGPSTGTSWVGFSAQTEVCAGRPNCLELFYEYDGGASPQQAQAWVNGIDLGASDLSFSGAWHEMQQLRVGAVDYRWDGDEPHSFPSALADLSGALWIDDVAYSPTNRSGCACRCTGPIHLTRAISPEAAVSSGAEVSGLHLRGVSAGTGGGGGAGGSGGAGVHLGGVRVKLG